jgi:hypothetical protein
MEMNWSRWSQCQSSFELLLVPNQPGIFALAEEVVQSAGSRRMLAVFEIQEADDLSRAMSRLFAAGSQWREKMAESRCYVRYAVVANAADRKTSTMALKNWLSSQRETASQIFEQPQSVTANQAVGEMRSERRLARAEHEGEAAQRGVALEENELKTMAERAVDRVTQGLRLNKAVPAGF